MTKENILIGTKSQHVKDNVSKVFDSTMLKDRINILYLDDVNLDYYTNLDNISYEDNALSSAMYYAEKSKINIVIGLSYALEIECWDFEKPKDLYCLSDDVLCENHIDIASSDRAFYLFGVPLTKADLSKQQKKQRTSRNTNGKNL